MEQNQRKRIARVLCANEVGERHSDFLRRREAVLSIENHGMRAVEHEHSGAGRLVLALVYLQIRIFDVERQLESLALNRTGERAGDVEIERIAEFVDLGSSAGLDSRRQVAGIVAAEAGLAE